MNAHSESTMTEPTDKTSVEVAVYSDYICPFCYIGYLRLEKLRDEYDLDVDWRFLEIHPDNPPEGKPVSELGYPLRQWQMMMDNLSRMAEEEGVTLAERTFTTNSRRALKLAEAVRQYQPDVFETLNRQLYEAYFLRRENIGDPEVLRALADVCGVEPALVDRAWDEPGFEAMLTRNQESAARLGVGGTPTYVFGDRVFSGAVPVALLRQAAAEASADTQS